jgi:hypothetical protein
MLWIDTAVRTVPEAGSVSQSATRRNLGVQDGDFDLPESCKEPQPSQP